MESLMRDEPTDEWKEGDSIPYTKLQQRNEPKHDRLKAILLERMKKKHVTRSDLAKAVGVSTRTIDRLLDQKNTDDWQIRYVITALRYVGVRMTFQTSCDAEE